MMETPSTDTQDARRRGVRRTLWVTGTIVVVIFLLSILSMLKTS